MRRGKRIAAALWVGFLLSVGGGLDSQDLYWEDPLFLVRSAGRFADSAAAGELVAVAWQESGPVTGDAYDLTISVATSTDSSAWAVNRKVVGPFGYAGEEGPVFSLQVLESGEIVIAVSVTERLIVVYRSTDMGRSFAEAGRIALTELGDAGEAGTESVVAPRLFVRSDGGLVMYLSKVDELSETRQLAIHYALSDDGEAWGPITPLANLEAEGIIRTFLPAHASIGGTDVVVFQAIVPGGDTPLFQLFSKRSTDSGRTWSPAAVVTGFTETDTGLIRQPREYDNQRPFIIPHGDRLLLTWERRLGRFTSPGVYFAELDERGALVATPEKITRQGVASRFPRIFVLGNDIRVTWFDNSSGRETVNIAFRAGAGLWIPRKLSGTDGDNTFARPYAVNGKPLVVWENRNRDVFSIVLLRPDKTAAVPAFLASASSFAPSGRYNQRNYRASWSLPRDSSGIDGFTVVWDGDPDGIAPADTSLLVPATERSSAFTAEQDGNYYLHVRAKDYAGNWSDTMTVGFTHDATPPSPVVFAPPRVDGAGYLASNTMTLSWLVPPEEDTASYRYAFSRLDADPAGPAFPSRYPVPRTVTTGTRIGFDNADDGLWVLSVSSVDTVGNVSEPSSLVVRMNKYVPVTYVTTVTAETDELGVTDMTIFGRGFSVGGEISAIILDRDTKEPWDYQLSDRFYTVASDRRIDAYGVENIEEGSYSVGVVHPLRGLHWLPDDSLAFEATGTVKYGYYRIIEETPPVLWRLAPFRRYSIPFNTVVMGAILLLLAAAMLFSIQRMGRIAVESVKLARDARVLILGAVDVEERKERYAYMKKRRFGLRLKFSVFTILLVISVVLILAIPTSISMINTQRETLAEGLEREVGVLLQGISTAAGEYLPTAENSLLDLLRLPNQGSGVSSVRFVTITGRQDNSPGLDLPPGYDYVWATSDPDLLAIDGFSEGSTRLMMENGNVLQGIDMMRSALEQEGQQKLVSILSEIERVSAEQREILDRTQDPDSEEYAAKREEITLLRRQEKGVLDEIGSFKGIYPDFDPKRLDPETTDYVFYTPIMFTTGNTASGFGFVQGTVLIGVSTTGILGEIARSQRDLILMTGGIAALAVLIGIAGALVLASIIIKPVNMLLEGVEHIRDTPDKTKLEDHVIDIRSGDEMAVLADAVNQMTRGLVAAAKSSQLLMFGKDIQKQFTPIEKAPDGRRLTTAQLVDKGIEFFGYYEGADELSGDYFDYRKLDDEHYAVIESDVSGHGVPSALIMVEVATIFNNYFRSWKLDQDGIHLDILASRINDLIEERGFESKFATLIIMIVNTRTGQCWLSNAGYNVLHMYNAEKGTMERMSLPNVPAAGALPSSIVEASSGFHQVSVRLKEGDAILLFTDGIEESGRSFRDRNLAEIVCDEAPGYREGQEIYHDERMTHKVGTNSEELGLGRIHDIVNAVMGRKNYRLSKYHAEAEGDLEFDFSTCKGSLDEAILALTAVERVFRVYPDPSATPSDRIMVDRKIDAFLEQHFKEYPRYFPSKIDHETRGEYVYYPGVKEDPQDDDLTILGIRKT